MSLADELTASVAVFFKLGFNPAIQRKIVESEGFEKEPERRGPIQVAPGVALGPSVTPIGKKGDTRLEYEDDRYLLRIIGPVSELKEACKAVSDIYGKYHYEFSKIVRYCEFHCPLQPIEVEGAVEKIRTNIGMGVFTKLSSIFGVEMKPYTISFSHPDTAQNDIWTHVEFEPEVNSPRNRVLLRITKRTETYEAMQDYLKNIEEKIGKIKALFREAKS